MSFTVKTSFRKSAREVLKRTGKRMRMGSKKWTDSASESSMILARLNLFGIIIFQLYLKKRTIYFLKQYNILSMRVYIYFFYTRFLRRENVKFQKKIQLLFLSSTVTVSRWNRSSLCKITFYAFFGKYKL